MRHLINIVHGIGAGMLCAVFLYLTGLVLTPRRWDEVFRAAGLLVFGTTVYVVFGWIGVTAQHIPQAQGSVAFAGAVLALSIIRNRRVVEAVVAGVGSGSLAIHLGLFVSFYVISYVLARPPASEMFLPPAWSGNTDLLTHARYAKHLLAFGSPHLDAASFDYVRSPAASHLLAAFSLLFNQDPLSAAMPFQFVLVSAAALAVVGVCRSLLSLPRVTSLAIACIFITNPYFRRIMSVYDLQPIIIVPVLCFLMWLIVRSRAVRSADGALIAALAGAYVLLCFTDLASLISALAIQGVVIAVMSIARLGTPKIGVPSLIAAAIVATALFARGYWSLGNLEMAAARTSAILTLGMSFLAFAAYIVWNDDMLRRVAPSPTDRRLAAAGLIYGAVALLVGSVAVHAAREHNPVRMPGKWRSLQQLQRLQPGELTVKIEHDPNRLLTTVTRYFLPRTDVRVIAPRVRVRDLPFATISRRNPMLIQNFSCNGVGHDDVTMIPDAGCVLFAPPSFALDRSYPFNRTFLFLTFDGLTEREPGGRWNIGRGVSIRLIVDPARTDVSRNLYVNFFVNPFFPPDVPPPTLLFKWGASRTGSSVLATEQWLSLPISPADWTRNEAWRLPISVVFPDRRTVLFHDLSVSEKPSGRLVQ